MNFPRYLLRMFGYVLMIQFRNCLLADKQKNFSPKKPSFLKYLRFLLIIFMDLM